MRRRGLLFWCLALIAAGCGSAANESAESPPDSGLLPAPPIEEVDEPAPDDVPLTLLDFREPPECERDPAACTEGASVCFELTLDEQGKSVGRDRECTESDLERLRDKAEEEVEPAPDAPPRIVARLHLSAERSMELIRWRTRRNEPCFVARLQPVGEYFGPIGPCGGEPPPCPAICLGQAWRPVAQPENALLYGVVSVGAEEIELALDAGEKRRYAVEGPVVADSDERVFMVDLGNRTFTSIETFAGGESLDRYTRPREEWAYERCLRRLSGDSLLTKDGQDEWEACLAAEGVEPDSE
jgi:hypothetical protein